MPNTINLRLLDNKNIIAEMNGISLGQENSYKIIAGEENATIFKIVSKPTKYTNATYTVEMVNSQGYGIEETDIINDTFDLPKGMAVAGYGWVQIRAYYTNNEGKEEVVPFMTLKVKVWNTLPNWKEHISEGGGGISQELIDKINKNTQSIEEIQDTIITDGDGTKFLNDKGEYVEVSGSGSGIRTLDTTPTTTTEGYVGEIVQVKDGTSYQCTAINEGAYTWVKLIKATDIATSSKAGVAMVSSSYGIGMGNATLTLQIANKEEMKAQTAVYKAISPQRIAYAVKQALINPDISTNFKADWTDEERALARTTLGATKLYKHTISCGVGRFVISFPEKFQIPEQQISLSGKSITFLSKKERPTDWQEYADIPYGMSTDWIDICQGMVYGQMENGELYGSIDKIGDYDIVWCGSTPIGDPSNSISGTDATIKLCIDAADAYTVDEL